VAGLQEVVAAIDEAWAACYAFDPRIDFFNVTVDAVANLTAIAQLIATSNASESCLAPINATLQVLFELTATVNSTVLHVDLDVDQQAFDALTQSIVDLQAALVMCQNYDNRTEFYETTGDILANLTSMAVSLLNSTASPTCQDPIEEAYVKLFELTMSVNATITQEDYTTDALNIAVLIEAFADLQTAWILCQAVNPLDEIAAINSELIAKLVAFKANVSASSAEQTCIDLVLADAQRYLEITTNFNDTLYTSNDTYGEAKNISNSLVDGYQTLQELWQSCSGASCKL
jgi:hypothetical protein